MKYANSYEEKIMNYKGSDYLELVAEFDETEIEEMRKELERSYDYDFSYAIENEVAELVVVEFIKEWLLDNIREQVIYGTEHLMKLYYSLV